MKKTILVPAITVVLSSGVVFRAAAGTHYTRLAYIETATTPTYVDTGFMPTPKTRTLIDIQFLDTATQYRFFGLQYGNLYYSVYENGNGNWAYTLHTASGSWNQVPPGKAVDTARHLIDYNFTNTARPGLSVHRRRGDRERRRSAGDAQQKRHRLTFPRRGPFWDVIV